MTRFFVDPTGKYIGGFSGASPPDGAIEVPSAPQDARQIWHFENAAWSAPPDGGSIDWPANRRAELRSQARALEESGEPLKAVITRLKALEE